MRYGAHLPLIELDDRHQDVRGLTAYVETAVDAGLTTIAANDHLVFARPWLDAIVALSAVIEASGDAILTTTAALPVIRGPVNLATAASALDTLSNGRFRLAVAPGSSPADYALVGIEFAERWRRLDEAIGVIKRHRPDRPIWVASWGSDAGLRRVARLGDGWLASAYNTTAADVAAARAQLRRHSQNLGRADIDLPCMVATMWLQITDHPSERNRILQLLAELLNRPPDVLAERLPIGPVEHCVRIVQGYADAGVETLCLWPATDAEQQLRRFMGEVAPQVRSAGAVPPSPPPAAPSSG